MAPTVHHKIERTNQTIKSLLTKRMHEMQQSWLTLLPLALLISHITPKSTTHLSPFKVLYGSTLLHTNLLLDPERHHVTQYVIFLGQTVSIINDHQNQCS